MNDKQIAAMDAALSDMLAIPDVEMLKRANDPRNEFAFFYNNPCPTCGAEMRREGRCWRCPRRCAGVMQPVKTEWTEYDGTNPPPNKSLVLVAIPAMKGTEWYWVIQDATTNVDTWIRKGDVYHVIPPLPNNS